jgi:transcriptional regulator with XRE-family HTH domain
VTTVSHIDVGGVKIDTLAYLGDRVKRARKERGLTQGELAKLAGCSVQTITKFEAGKDICAITYMGICRALGIKITFKHEVG